MIFDLTLTSQVTSILSYSGASCRELSNAALHDSLRPTVHEIAGGVISPPGTQECASSPDGDGLTRAALGYPVERAAIGGEYPPANSQTNSRGGGGTSETAIENSQREDYYELLKVS